MMSNDKKRQSAMMLGVGLDSDGHKRVTRGREFVLLGGSAETHERMTEIAVKVEEKLKKRGKHLADVTPEEFGDLVSGAADQ